MYAYNIRTYIHIQTGFNSTNLDLSEESENHAHRFGVDHIIQYGNCEIHQYVNIM